MPNKIRKLNFNDTFLDFEHLKTCFPQYSIKVSSCSFVLDFVLTKKRTDINNSLSSMFLVHNGQSRWTSTTLHVRSILSISMYCYVVKCEPYLLHAKGILYMTKQTFQNLKQKHKADLKGRKKKCATYSSHDFASFDFSLCFVDNVVRRFCANH